MKPGMVAEAVAEEEEHTYFIPGPQVFLSLLLLEKKKRKTFPLVESR